MSDKPDDWTPLGEVLPGRVTHLTEEQLAVLCTNEECRHGRWEHGYPGDDFTGSCGSEGSVPNADGDYAFVRCYCAKFEP